MDQLEDEPELLIKFDVAVDSDRHATVTIAGELDMTVSTLWRPRFRRHWTVV